MSGKKNKIRGSEIHDSQNNKKPLKTMKKEKTII